jgi:hypothetical protein
MTADREQPLSIEELADELIDALERISRAFRLLAAGPRPPRGGISVDEPASRSLRLAA